MTALVTWVSQLSETGALAVRFPEPWPLMLRCLEIKRLRRDIHRPLTDQRTTHIYPISILISMIFHQICETPRFLQHMFQN
jgi:hypothetical protein